MFKFSSRSAALRLNASNSGIFFCFLVLYSLLKPRNGDADGSRGQNSDNSPATLFPLLGPAWFAIVVPSVMLRRVCMERSSCGGRVCVPLTVSPGTLLSSWPIHPGCTVPAESSGTLIPHSQAAKKRAHSRSRVCILHVLRCVHFLDAAPFISKTCFPSSGPCLYRGYGSSEDLPLVEGTLDLPPVLCSGCRVDQ